jgi:hypothetical protein
MTLQGQQVAGTCFCARMELQVRGHGSLVEVVCSMATSPHQLKEGGMGAATTSVLAPRQQQQQANWKLQK